MSSRIYHTILNVIVREIIAVFRPVKGILQDFHAGISRIFKKFFRHRRESSEIFRYDRNISERTFKVLKEVHARSFADLTFLRRLISIGHSIILGKSVEVINAEDVIEFHIAGDPVDPPLIARLLKGFPVIERVSPQLSRFGECIRRASRDVDRISFLVHMEDLLVCP